MMLRRKQTRLFVRTNNRRTNRRTGCDGKKDCLFYANAIKMQMVGIRFLVGATYMQSLCSKHLSHKPLSMLACSHIVAAFGRQLEDVSVRWRGHKMDNNKNGMKQISRTHIVPPSATTWPFGRWKQKNGEQRRWPTNVGQQPARRGRCDASMEKEIASDAKLNHGHR